MKRRINLYNPHKPKRSFEPLSLGGSIQIVAGFTVFAVLAGVLLSYLASSQQDTYSGLQAQKKRIDGEIATEEQRFASQQVRPELLQEKQRIEDEILARGHLKSLLHRLQPAQTVYFSSYLYAMSKASQPNSWLTQFQLNTEASQFSFSGAALNAPNVPEMFEALGKSDVFSGMRVSQLSVEAEDEKVNFKAVAELRSYE